MAMREDRDVDSLLAQGRVSGPERERIFDAVVARVAPRRAWSGGRLFAGLFTLAGAAAAVFLLARPATDDSGFTAKGGSPAGAAALDLACAGASLTACPIGATLVFAVHGTAQPGFLAAYAEPLAPGAERIIYFSRDGEAPALAAAADGTQAFSRGIRVGAEHTPGAYRVHIYLTRAPASRAALAAGLPAADVVATRVVPLAIVAP